MHSLPVVKVMGHSLFSYKRIEGRVLQSHMASFGLRDQNSMQMSAVRSQAITHRLDPFFVEQFS